MKIFARVLLLLPALFGFVVCRRDNFLPTINRYSSPTTNGTSPFQFLRKTRRMLSPHVLENLRMNLTFRRRFCETCRPRNCQRRVLLRRCASESSKAKKCACCNFCPHKWRTLRSTDRPPKDWQTSDGLREIISTIQKKLPPQTARVCLRHNVRCSSAQLCLLNIQNLPVCRCLPEEACGRGTAETIVCGANGTTYLSRCHLLVAACRLQQELQPLRAGQCKEGDAESLLAMQVRIPLRRKELRRRHRYRFEKRRAKRRRYADRLLRLIQLNQRERRRLFREMKRFRRLQRNRNAHN